MPQIKFLNKFVLANILKNFRWLKFDFNRNLNNLHNCPRCYSLSLRYSIYKVQTRSFRSFLSAANFYILAHIVELVKNFFQVFSNSICARCAPGEAVHHATFTFYHNHFALSRTFFLFFRSFLICRCRPARDLHILAHRLPIVKHFFTISSILF